MYTTMREELEKFIKDREEVVDDFLGYFPKCYEGREYLADDDLKNDVIVLEDIGSAGYSMWKDEIEGLDLQHVLITMEAIGKLHGLYASFLDGPGFKTPLSNKLLDLGTESEFSEGDVKLSIPWIASYVDYLKKTGELESADRLNKVKEMDVAPYMWKL